MLKLSENKYFAVKVIVISTIILAYAMLSHYPRMYMFYRDVAPYQGSEADIIINVPDLPATTRFIYKTLGVNLTKPINTSLLVEILLQEIDGAFGLERYAPVYQARVSVESESGSSTTANLVIIDRGEDLKLLLAYDVDASLRSGTVIADAIAPAEFSKTNRFIYIDGKKFKIIDRAFISGFYAPGKPSMPTYVILRGDLPPGVRYRLAGIMVSTERGCSQDALPGVVAKAVIRYINVTENVTVDVSVDGLVALAGRQGYRLDSDVLCREYMMSLDMKLYEENYGLHTEWGAIMFAALVAFVAYIAKVAYSDVADRIRDLVALLYAMGASDGQVSFILVLYTLVFVVPALLGGVVLVYLYMGNMLGFYFPFALMFQWFSPLIAGGVAVAVAVSLGAGLYAVRRKPLSQVLSGA